MEMMKPSKNLKKDIQGWNKIEDLLECYRITPPVDCEHSKVRTLSIITDVGVYEICPICEGQLHFYQTPNSQNNFVSLAQQEKL